MYPPPDASRGATADLCDVFVPDPVDIITQRKVQIVEPIFRFGLAGQVQALSFPACIVQRVVAPVSVEHARHSVLAFHAWCADVGSKVTEILVSFSTSYHSRSLSLC